MGARAVSFCNYSYTYHTAGFDPKVALVDVSIRDVQPGEIVCVVGPNGSGKTTLLDLIARRRKPRVGQGETVVQEAGREGPTPTLRIGYVPQVPADGLVADLTIVENVVLQSSLTQGKRLGWAVGKSVRREVRERLRVVGLDALLDKLDMPPAALSDGQRQILNMIAAMWARPDLILCDEPTSKLDERNRICVASLVVKAAHETGCAVLCASHDHEVVARVADRVVALENGRVAGETVLRRPLTPRFVGEVRYCDATSDLPTSLSNIETEWWRPDEGRLFAEAYLLGDDSAEGYLADRPLTREARTLREVEGVVKMLGLTGKEKILDAPCGWGRHSLELASRGYDVTGVDLSDRYISTAQAAAGGMTRTGIVRFVRGDMRNIPVPNGSFDVVCNLWTSFGFFDAEGDQQVLREFARILKPGGRILIHSDHNPERVKLGIFDEPPLRRLQSGGNLEVREYYCASERAVFGEWKVGKLGTSHTFRLNLYTVRDWEAIAPKVGLKVQSVWGGFDGAGSLLTARSQEFVVVLVKA